MANKRYKLTFSLHDGTKKSVEFEVPQGNPGRGIVDITRTAGTGAPGTVDTYTIKFTDNTTSTFTIYNGADGKCDGSVSYNEVQELTEEQKAQARENIGAQPVGDYLTEHQSLDGYAKTSDIPKKPEDIGAQPSGNYALKSEIPSVPVQSVNGKTGSVNLSASDVGARPDNWMPTAAQVGALPSTYTPPNQTAQQVGADPSGTAGTAVSQHNTANDSHNDIRLELKAINDRLTAFFDSDDQTLDELSEIVAYITSNKALIDSITTSKVSVADIINNLTTNVSNKPLSAAQGVALNDMYYKLSNRLKGYQLKGDYLERTELTTAVNDALAQAKESGEFDGPQGAAGYTPVKGTDYYTETDKTEMVNAVIAALPVYSGEVV